MIVLWVEAWIVNLSWLCGWKPSHGSLMLPGLVLIVFMQWGIVHKYTMILFRQQNHESVVRRGLGMIGVCNDALCINIYHNLLCAANPWLFYALMPRCINLSGFCCGINVMVVLCNEAWCTTLSWFCYGSKIMIVSCTEAWCINDLCNVVLCINLSCFCVLLQIMIVLCHEALVHKHFIILCGSKNHDTLHKCISAPNYHDAADNAKSW